MGSEALGLSLESITVFPAMPVPWDGNNFSFLSPGFVVTLGGKVGAKPNIKISVVSVIYLKENSGGALSYFSLPITKLPLKLQMKGNYSKKLIKIEKHLS